MDLYIYNVTGKMLKWGITGSCGDVLTVLLFSCVIHFLLEANHAVDIDIVYARVKCISVWEHWQGLSLSYVMMVSCFKYL